MAQGGYVLVDLEKLVLDGVENTLNGISKKIATVYNLGKPIVVNNLTLKKELTGLTNDVFVPTAYCSVVVANDVYVLTTMIASMNININIDLTDDTYKGIKF